MTKFLMKVFFVGLMAFSAPTADASISLAQQRIEVYDALDVIIDEFEDQIAIAEAALAGLDPFSFAARVLRREILILNGRVRFVAAIQNGVPFYSQPVLDRIIIRFDLPVSLS